MLAMHRLFLFNEDGLLPISRLASALLAVLLLAAAPAFAQTAAAPATDTTQLEQANADLDKAGSQLNGIRERVEKAAERHLTLDAREVAR